jgi:hydroxymethylglutaryl-CoA lyase
MIDLMEVSPRDGLQDHPVLVPTEVKVALIRRAFAAGLRTIEIASFAHPARVPQMADAEAVIAATADLVGLRRVALVLNEKGLDRALDSGIADVNVVVVCSETFSQKNQGMSVPDLLSGWERIAARANGAGLRATVTISAAFGCPYERDLPEAQVHEVVRRAVGAGPAAVTLADTIGSAVPTMVEDLVGWTGSLGPTPVRCHLHDTRNTGVANAVAALRAGAVGLDASLGGLGGCPFAPGATGNVATEDLVWCLERMGIPTGVDLGAALETVSWMTGIFGVEGRRVGGAVARAGAF